MMADGEPQTKDPSSPLENAPVLPPEGPREDLIKTAVNFLQNPKVVQSPLAQKRAFLVRKGLTQQEIDVAINQSGAVVAENARLAAQASQPSHPQHVASVAAPAPAPVSLWTRCRDYTATALVVGGATYGVYRLVMTYVMPRFRKSEEDKLEKINNSVEELQASMTSTLTKLQENMAAMQEVMERQEAMVNTVLRTVTNGQGQSSVNNLDGAQGVGEIKTEIASLKALLLSRRQFPPSPAQAPIIPSWQLPAKEEISVSNTVTPSGTQDDEKDSAAAEDQSRDNDTSCKQATSEDDVQLLNGDQVKIEPDSKSPQDSSEGQDNIQGHLDSQGQSDLKDQGHVETELPDTSPSRDGAID